MMSTLKSITSHYCALAELITASELTEHDPIDYFDWSHVADWLLLAAGIIRIEFDQARLDPAFGWCRDADNYYLQRDELLAEMVTAVSKFIYSWGSLESLIDLLAPPIDPSNKGKINAACKYILDKYDATKPLPYYAEEVARFRALVHAIPHYQPLESEFRDERQVGFYGIGLHMVYKIRNRIAHGALEFPYPREETNTKSDLELIETSLRIVLLSIQLLLSAYFHAQSFEIESFGSDAETIGIHELLRKIHLEEDYEDVAPTAH